MTHGTGPLLLIFLIFLPLTLSLRSFTLILTDSKCTVRNDYITALSCTLNKSESANPRLNIYGKLQKEIRDLRIDLSIALIRRNRESVTLFKANGLEGCTFLYTNITLPMLRMYRDMLLKHGEWPSHCPIPVGFEYKFREITLDPDYLPTFVPEAEFQVSIIQYDKKIKFWHTVIYGRIAHKKKNKFNRNY